MGRGECTHLICTDAPNICQTAVASPGVLRDEFDDGLGALAQQIHCTIGTLIERSQATMVTQ